MNWEAKSDPVADIKAAKQHLTQMTGMKNPVLVVSQGAFEKISYVLNTELIRNYSGYKKMRGPDGKVWFEKKRDYDLRGSGNKAKKRALKLGYKTKEKL